MSVIKIKGSSANTGDFTIQPPNSSTDRTLTLPDRAGVIAAGNGTIIQVVSSKNPSTIQTGTSTSTDVTFHSQTITPTSSSNKILVTSTCFTERGGGSGANYCWISLFRDSTEIVQNWGNAMNYQHNNNSRSHAALTHLDSPATTSQVTYRVSADMSPSGGNNFYLYNCVITLMEIVV
jgi:hypothetical protein